MVTWHLRMKLYPVKCHERATLQKLWHQTGNCSLLPMECWLLLQVIRGGLILSLKSQHIFSKISFVLFCYITGPMGNIEFCFPRISMFPLPLSWETLRSSGNKIHCSPRDQSLSVNCYLKMCLKGNQLTLHLCPSHNIPLWWIWGITKKR